MKNFDEEFMSDFLNHFPAYYSYSYDDDDDDDDDHDDDDYSGATSF